VVLMSILAIYIGLLVFSVNSRYRAPAVPGLAIFAGFGLVTLIDSLAKRTWWEAAKSLSYVTIPALIALVPFPAPLISAGVWANMGAAYLAQGQTDKAIQLLQKSIDMNPRFAYAHLILGIAMDNEGKTEEAAEHYAVAVKLSPTNPEAHHRLGTSLAKRGEIDQAIEQYMQALRIKPNYAEANYSLGVALTQKGDLEGAMRQYRKAIANYPQYAKAYLNLGVVFDELNKPDEAMACYRKAIEIQPNLAEAHNNLAVDLYLKGDYAGAWKEVRLARKYGLEPIPSFIQALSTKMPGDSDSH
ncbi:MAG: tetratricopeptide repeat protein, partial [Armatimonadetes bacterium]|nr:tetratricopeptide repeat protein [Armatimonadota bacterium]